MYRLVFILFQSTRGQWKKVFFISSGIYLFGMIVFVLFGSGKEQLWAKPGYPELKKKKKQQQRQGHIQVSDDDVLNFSRTAPLNSSGNFSEDLE